MWQGTFSEYRHLVMNDTKVLEKHAVKLTLKF